MAKRATSTARAGRPLPGVSARRWPASPAAFDRRRNSADGVANRSDIPDIPLLAPCRPRRLAGRRATRGFRHRTLTIPSYPLRCNYAGSIRERARPSRHVPGLKESSLAFFWRAWVFWTVVLDGVAVHFGGAARNLRCTLDKVEGWYFPHSLIPLREESCSSPSRGAQARRPTSSPP